MSEPTTVSARISPNEIQMVSDLKEATGCTQSEIIRRGIWIQHAIQFGWVTEFWERVREFVGIYKEQANDTPE